MERNEWNSAMMQAEFERFSLYDGESRNLGTPSYSNFNVNGNVNMNEFPLSLLLRREFDIYRMRIQSAVRGQQYAQFNSRLSFDVQLYNYSDLGVSNETRNYSDWRNMIRRPRQRANVSSLNELRGRIFSVAMDQNGCRFLQSKFEEGKAEDIQMIFMEVKDHICELMVDKFGNSLVQKFVSICNQHQMSQLLVSLVRDERRFMDICMDYHGSRSVQRMLQFLTTADQRRCFTSVLSRITFQLTKNINGHHVIEHFLKFFSSEDKGHILNAVANHCMEIATDKCGCCVIQQCLEHGTGEARERLISELNSNALMLSKDPYGNYVVQLILGMKLRKASDILAQLSQNIVFLSMDKIGSNVVEKFLKNPEFTQEKDLIIQELISSPHFLRVLRDPYGNYVAQSAFGASRGELRTAMLNLIQSNHVHLHNHPYGHRVLQCIRHGRQRGNRIRHV